MMDELDIYDDLDEFHEQEEKKSKELVALEAKYEEALKNIEAMKMEKKDLRKKVRIMEHNLQSLLDTAKSEVKRKDKLIEDLRKEIDDLCFRRNRVQSKTNQSSFGKDPRLGVDAEETLLDRDCHLKANWNNPFKQQPPNVFNDQCTSTEAKFDSKQLRNIKEFASKEDNVNKNPSKTMETNRVVDNCDVILTNNIVGNLPNITSEKPSSKNFPIVGKQHNRTDSKERCESKDRDRYKKNYDNESEEDKHQIKYRSRHRDTYIETFRKQSKDKSREKSSSPRNGNEIHSNRRKTDKDKSDRYRYDGHSSYRRYKNEHRDRSRSSDRYEKSNRSHRYKGKSKKKQSKKEKSTSKKEDRKNSDRHYKSRHKDEDTSRRSKDKSKKRKRRHSSSDEDRHNKRHHSQKEGNAEKSSDAKRLLLEKDLVLEKIENSYDYLNIESNSLLISSKGSIPKNIDSENSDERDKHLVQIENGVEEGISSDQLDKDVKCIVKSKVNEKKIEFDFKVQDELEILQPSETNITPDNFKLKITEKDKPISTDRNELEKQPENETNISIDIFEIKTSEEDKLKISQQRNTNITANKVKEKSIEQNVLKALKQSERNTVASNFESKSIEQKTLFMTLGTHENQSSATPKESREADVKDDIYQQQQVAGCLNFDDIKISFSNETLNDTSEEHNNSGDSAMTLDNGEVATIIENTVGKLSCSSMEHSYEENNTKENNTKGSLSESALFDVSSKNLNTSEKLALFDKLFGTTSSSMNTSPDTIENVKAILGSSSNSSRTTSPSLYTDVSQTPSRNSPKMLDTSSNKKGEMVIINAEKTNIPTLESKTFFDFVNTKILKPFLNNSNVQCYDLNDNEKYSNLAREEHITQPPSLKSKCVIPGLKSADTLNVERIEAENVDSKIATLIGKANNSSMNFGCIVNGDSKTNIPITETSSKVEIQKSYNALDLIENQSLREDENIPTIAPDVELDKHKSSEQSPEHELQTICLVDIFDDEVNNKIPTLPLTVNEDKGFRKRANNESNAGELSNPTEIDSFDRDVLKEINEECSRLQLALKNPSNKMQLPIAYHEETLNVVESEQAHDSSEMPESNVIQEPDKVTDIISMPEKDSNNVKAQNSNMNDETPIVIELDNDDEPMLFNLTLSSDEDDETLANLKKKYKLEQKEKIEILENIRLPTLFQPRTKDKRAQLTNIVEIETKRTEINAEDSKDEKLAEKVSYPTLKISEMKQLCQNKIRLMKSKITAPIEHESIPVIDITEDNLKNSPKRMVIDIVDDFKDQEIKIHSQNGKDEELSENIAAPVLKISEEKEIGQKKTGQMSSKMPSPLENESITIIDITEDSLLEESKNRAILKGKKSDNQKGIIKKTENTCFGTDDKTEKELVTNAANKSTIDEIKRSTKDTLISSFPVNNELTAESRNDIIDSSNNIIGLLPKQQNNGDIVPKLKTLKQKLPNQKSKGFIKLDVGKCKERRRLTEHNGKILPGDEKRKQQDSLGEMLSENMEETTATPRKSKTAKQLSPKSSIKKTPTGRSLLTKELRIRIPRLLKKSPVRANASALLMKKSPSKSPKNCCGNSLKIPARRKLSTPASSPKFNDSLSDSNMLKDKSEKLSTSAEVRAMLIDGKSPQINNDSIVTSPLNIMQDTNLDELDKNMEAIFQSPAKLGHTFPPIASMPCCNSTILDITIDETANLESSTASENLNKTNDSSFESKRLSIGTTQYVYERVSENVVNLFITRRHSKKRAKLDNNIATK